LYLLTVKTVFILLNFYKTLNQALVIIHGLQFYYGLAQPFL